MSQSILQVKNLTKQFGEFTAVNNISFSLEEGEILGLLGINGAGKTTTLQMLLGVLTPTSGTISYFGHNLQTHRTKILELVNFSSTYTNLPWVLTVAECLKFVSYLYAIPNRKQRIEKIVEIFQLQTLLKKQISKLSAGQKTRVNLAKALLNYPKVLLLDEPTASLDPDIAQYIREFLLNQRDSFKMSIIITSHNMNEVEEICDRVVFINKGQIIADDKPETLAKTIEISHIELLITKGFEKAIKYCLKQGIAYHKEGKFLIIDVKEKQIAQFLRNLMEQDVVYNEISIEKPSLEDYFLQVAQTRKDSRIT